MATVCFWIEPTDKVQRWLRRYASSNDRPEIPPCSLMPGLYSYHNAMTELDRITSKPDGRGYTNAESFDEAHVDPRWPKQCGCGYPFESSDHWQTFVDRVYRRTDSGEEYPLRDVPDGALWDAFWLHNVDGYGHADGRVVMCRLPGGHDWIIDGPSSSADGSKLGPKWSRTGDVPHITVSPSIGIPNKAGGWTYHAYLNSGRLEEC